ncbi:BLUF domain-containing protein [Dyadobacter sp. CY347]|uniref:BLUF domain-containing protein n=1 Tax=Dyadobacter sp. CY347 TaxID=2909336 RepID=UPI001F2CDDE9|nr:BLUF domain-containing protein [Dyadobacter sp. CY347]MCF2487339.1 BLUF domain-containing protein [Dyadobacter sp. CY347]
MDYTLVYLSSSVGLLSEDEISGILAQSHANNGSLNITGILLYCNGSIIQVLEGEKGKVEALYNTIARDTRHKNLLRLFSAEIEQRSFPDWLMGYRTLASHEFDHLQEFLPFVSNPLSAASNKDGAVMGLLKSFYKNNHRN